MGLFTLASWTLAVIVAVTIYWPANIPLMALAYKVRHGTGTLPHEPGPFWIRSTFAALGLAVLTGLTLALNRVLVDRFGMPEGPVHLILIMSYLPLGAGYLFWMMAYEDVGESLSLLVLYIFLPGAVLLLIDRVFHFWQPVYGALLWLQPSPL